MTTRATQPDSDEAFEALLGNYKVRVAQRREEALAGDPSRDAQAWLAAVPWVTAEVASAASMPSGGSGPAALLKALVREGRLAELPTDPPRYELPTALRSVWRQGVQSANSTGDHPVFDEVARVGASLAAVNALPDELRRWSSLLSDVANPEDCAARFRARVEAACPALRDGAPPEQPTADSELAEVNLWIETAQRLRDLLDTQSGERLRLEIHLAKYRLHRALRRADCADRTARFLDRPALTGEVRRLLDPASETWALHLLGVGGAGKTMLLRHLEARVFPRDVPVARVDFDDLDPSFPTRDPGLLLDEALGTFRLWDEGDVTAGPTASFRDLRNLVQKQLPPSGWDPSAKETLPALERLLDLFAEALSIVSRGVAVLVLDTCEELARVSPEGEAPRNVVGTFVLLEEIHRRFKGLRVLFSGRRPLAREYANTTVQAAPSGLSSRTYLRLAVVEGFDDTEAASLFDLMERGRGARKIPNDFRQAILRQCPALRHEQLKVLPGPQRYSPFELAFMGRLVMTDESVRVEHLATPEKYIRERIVGRFDLPRDGRARRPEDEMVRRSLPVLAALGLLDVAIVSAVFPGDAARSVLEEIGRQEWASFDGVRVRVHPVFRARLSRFFHDESEHHEAIDRALTHLEATTPEAPLDQPLIDLCEGLSWNLVKTPERFHTWWERLEEHVAREEAYDWVEVASGRLLAPDGALGDRPAGGGEDPCGAAVRATQIAFQLRRASSYDRRSLWGEVAERCAPWQRDLRLRAAAGCVAALLDSGTAPGAPELTALRASWIAAERPWKCQVWGALTAAAEALVEQAERDRTPIPREWSERLRATQFHAKALADDSARDLAAFWAALAGRILCLEDRTEEAEEAFRSGAELLPPTTRTADRWLDWWAPSAVRVRVQAERLRVMARSRRPEELLSDQSMAPSARELVPRTTDEDRYCSLWWDLRRRFEVVNEAPPDPSFDVPRPWRRNLHDEVPPWFVVRALLTADRGEVMSAVSQLRSESLVLESFGAADARDGERHARAALAELALRFRLVEDGVVSVHQLLGSEGESSSADGIVAIETLRAFYDERLQSTPQLGSFAGSYADTPHAVWRVLTANSREEAEALVEFASSVIASRVEVDRGSPQLTLDLREADLLAERWRVTKPTVLSNSEAQRRRRRGDRTWLRALALGGGGESDEAETQRRRLDKRARDFGLHRTAEEVLEEGAVLALRLPHLARPLLSWAEEAFAKAGDHAGAFRAACAGAMSTLYEGAPLSPAARSGLLLSLAKAFPQDRELPDLALAWSEGASLSPSISRIGGWAGWIRRLRAVLGAGHIRAGATYRAWVEASCEGSVPRDLARLIQAVERRTEGQADFSQAIANQAPIRGGPAGLFSWARTLSFRALEETTKLVPRRAELERMRVEFHFEEGSADFLIEGITARSYPEQLGIPLNLDRRPRVNLALIGRGPYCVEVDSVTASIAWEGLLPGADSTLLFRAIPSRKWANPRPKEPLVDVICDDLKLGTEILRSWRWPTVPLRATSPEEAFTPRSKSSSGRVSPANVVHLIADPTWTSGGPRLAFGSLKRGLLAGPEELVRTMPLLWLCVLQGQPTTDTRRSPSVRHASRLLRCFGADLAALGVPIVVLVPALPMRVGQRVINTLARITRHFNEPLRVLEWVEEARMLLRKPFEAPSKDRDEFAADLVLHLHPDIFGRSPVEFAPP